MYYMHNYFIKDAKKTVNTSQFLPKIGPFSLRSPITDEQAWYLRFHVTC